MGMLARLLGTDPETRVTKVRRFIERGRFNDARWELEELDHPDAPALREVAMAGLVVLNLEESRARFTSGDVVGAKDHLELARQYGATSEELKGVRKFARELRERREAEAAAAAEAEIVVEPEGDDPLWRLPPDDPRLRYAMLLEGWPDDLRTRLSKLPAAFAQSVLLIEDGQAARAHEELGRWVEQEPAVRYERVRAALQSGKIPAAISDLKAFGDRPGHRRIGQTHTGALLVQLLGRAGRAKEALAEAEHQLRTDPDLGLRILRAQLLEATGEVDIAQDEVEKLLIAAPKDQGLYRLLARIRLRLGNRLGAMQALEGGLAKTCCSPGKCGNQAYDVAAARMLAALYLEDRAQPDRAQELLAELQKNVREPAWEDGYIAALVARNRGAPDVAAMADRLLQSLGKNDARRETVHKAFPVMLTG